ncbi:hypothetical protein PCANC_01245 [Puccinia coronata f. sp. avenae]|nr:hypothetical protein PCANC_05052 [Puccinia coronata f. sp. avenae]PLW56933.1 hypothetical protein PCANC_01245 [Puccinia coronata f. sp. avenae]
MGSTTTEASTHPTHILSTTDGETAFFRSIIRYRPRGANRHFSMVGMCKDLERELHTVIPSEEIWSTLRSCYDLDILAEMEPDESEEIDRSKSTPEILRSKQHTLFREFQLPIHPSVPPEQSFLKLVDERRLELDHPSPEQRSPKVVHSPRRRTTTNSLKLHIDRSSHSSSKYLNTPSAKSTTDHRQGDSILQEGMESDLTEQEDYEEEEDEDEEKEHEGHEDEDEEEREQEEEDDEDDDDDEPVPEPRSKKQKTSNSNSKASTSDSLTKVATTSRSRSTGNSNKTPTNNNMSISSNTTSTSRSRTRARSKR